MKPYKGLFNEEYEKIPLNKIITSSFIKKFIKEYEWNIEQKYMQFLSNVKTDLDTFKKIVQTYINNKFNLGANLLSQTMDQFKPEDWDKFLELYGIALEQHYK